MEQQSVRDIISITHWPRVMLTAALGMLALFLFVLTASELRSYNYIGSGVTATNTITVDGTGDASAVPDTATFSVTVQQEAKDVKTAQDATTKKGNDIIAYLKEQGIDEKDIQTTDYSISPQYDYSSVACSGGYCPPGKQTLRGYQVSETVSVKVRDTKKAGDLLSGVGSRGATDVSGLSFTVDQPDAVQAQARDKAITQAKEKAEVLAKSLGVTLVRIVGFSENGGGRAYPMYAKMDMMSVSSAGASPEIATGQNKYTSNVSITYEVR